MDTDIFNGFPTHIEKAGGLLKISLQKDHKLGTFVESYLHENLKELKSSRFIPEREELVPGTVGIGQFDDNQYYRIQVLEHLSNKLISVLFIDYGNVASLALSDIRLLNYEVHKTLLNIPALAITCYLENVWVSKPWNDDELNTLKKLVLYEEKQCIVRQLHPKVKVVNIFFHNASKKLTELILENDLGSPISDVDLFNAVKSMRNNRLGSITDERSLSLAHQFAPRLSTISDNFIPERISQSREQITLKNFSSAHMLSVGSSHNAYISHMKDGPYSFSIQLKSSAEDALPRLTRLLKQAEPVLNNRALLPGTMVMTRYHQDNSFRRSIVVDVQSDICHVYHTDYGSSEEVPFSEVYELPSQAQHAPSMALRFCLADIKKTQVTESSKAQFQELLQGKQVLIRVVKQEGEGPLLQYCEMFYEGRNVKDILVAFNAPLEYTLQQPPRGKDLKITVSHIEGPSMFFIQYNSKLDLLNNIQEAVKNHCKHHPRLKDMAGLSIGSPVAALFEDNVWYRAMILSLGTESAQVSYVDYGNRCEVFMSQLCQISRDLVTKWRSQAVECCLNGFENDNASETNEQVIALMEDTLNHTYNMTPIKILSTNRLLVELIDEDCNKISDKIKTLKHPKHQPVTNFPVTHLVQETPVMSVETPPERDSSSLDQKGSKSKEKNDNMFVRPSVRPILEQQNKSYPTNEDYIPNKPYTQHDDRCDDLSRKLRYEKPPRFKNQESRQRNAGENQNRKLDSWDDAGSRDLNSSFGSHSSPTQSKESFSKGGGFGRSTPNDENDHRRGKFRSDGAGDGWNAEKLKFGDRPKFGNRGEGRGSKASDASDDGGSDWNSKERPKSFANNRFNDRRNNDGDSGGRFGGTPRKFGSGRNDDGGESDGRFGGRRNDGESGGRFARREGGESSGRFGGGRRDFSERGGGRRDFGEREGGRRDFGEREGGRRDFGEREGGRRDFGEREGGRRDNNEREGGKFGGRRSDFESNGGRFGSNDRDSKGGDRFGNNRRDDGEKKGGRSWDNEFAGGKRDGGKFGKDNFIKKGFQSGAFDGNSNSGFSPCEEWTDSSTSIVTPMTEAPKTVSSSYPIPAVTVNSSLQVILTSIASPHQFYVQQVGCETELEEVRALIDNKKKELQQFKEDLLAPGVPLLARFSDDQELYRGLIKHIFPPSQAKILFVDYGNSEVVSSKDLYFIPPEILNKAPLSFCCYLLDIKPVNEEWPEDTSLFDPYLNGEDMITLSVSSVKMIDGEMVISGTAKNLQGDCISQSLISGGLAISTAGTKGTVPSERSSQPVLSAETLPTTNQVIQAEDNQESTESLGVKKPIILDKWIDCMDLLKDQMLYGEILEFVDDRSFVISILDAKVVTLATLGSHQSPSCITPGKYVIAEVLEVLNDRLLISLFGLDGIEMGSLIEDNREARAISPLCKFPVVRKSDFVIICHSENNTVFITRQAESDRLSILLDEMYSFYEERTRKSEEWTTNALCAAKSLADDNWYRAKIIQCDTSYEVRYLDYGNTEELPPENLRTLDSQFYFPEMSLNVSLPFIWKSNDTQLLDAFIGEEFYCTIIRGPNGQWIADFINSSGKNLADLISDLCEIELNPDNPFNEVNSGIGSSITAGDNLPVLVTHTDSPTMFWVQKQSDVKTVDLLHNNLQVTAPNCDAASNLDKVFAAKFTADDLWYRATRVSGDSLRFIDYGNTDSLTEAKKMPENMQKPLSGYAIPMYLCAKPINDSWSDESIKEFEMFIEHDIVAEIISVDYKIVADLREGNKYLSNILVDAGYATYTDYVPENVKKYTQKMISDSFSLRIFADSAPKSPEEDTPGTDKVKVYVSHANSVNDFYIQEELKSAEIEAMANQLHGLDDEPCLKEVQIGGIYAVKFEDGVWYRARIISNDPEIKVFFIDSGKTFIASDIRSLPNNLTKKDPLALHCSLGIEESERALNNFLTLSDHGNGVLFMIIRSQGTPNIVELFDEHDTNILSQLEGALEVEVPGQLLTRQKVYLTHIYGPDAFYAQTRELMSKCDDMTAEMLEAESFEKLTEIAVGDIIAALYPEDNCWYRAEVLSSAPDIVVRFIDFGNTSVVTELRDLPPFLKKVRALTIKCALQLPDGCENWSEACQELFNSICINNADFLELEFILEGPMNYVELYVNGEPVTKNLIFELMSHKLTPLSTSETGKQVKGYITHVNSVSDFYIQREDCADLLNLIQSRLSELGNVNSKPDCGIGSLIAAKFVDGEWYRGQILLIDPEIRVRFIDYGNECNVSEISGLTEELLQIPPVAIKCSLDVREKSLKDNAKKLFEKYCCGDTQFDYSITSVVDDISFVEIILDGENVLNKLCLEGDVEKTDTNNESMPLEELIETIPTGTNEDARHSDEDFIEKNIKGFISHINSISDFYIQEKSSIDHLEEIQTTLAELEFSDVPLKVEVSDIVSAKCEEDGIWYRAEIIKVEPKVCVRFIDYGNESEVSELRKLSNDLVELPALAIKCSLRKDDELVKEIFNKSFITLCGSPEKLLDFKIVSCFNGVSEVEIYLNGDNISSQLHNMNESTNLSDNIEPEEICDTNDISNSSECDKVCDMKVVEDINVSDCEISQDICNEAIPSLESYEKNSEEEKGTSIKQNDTCEKESTELSRKEFSEDQCEDTTQPDEKVYYFPTRRNLISSVKSVTDFFLNPESPELNHIIEVLEGADHFEDTTGVSKDDVLAGRTEGGLWYRCRIEEIVSDNGFKVFLIDNGCFAHVHEVKELPSELILVNARSFNCSLFLPEGIHSWSENASEKFIEIHDQVIGYEMVDDSVSPCIVKLLTNSGDLSDQLAIYCSHENTTELEDKELNKSREITVENEKLDIDCDVKIQEVSNSKKEETPVIEKKNGANTVPSAKSLVKSATPTKVKTVAEIKANAKSKVNSRPSISPQPQKKVDKLHQPLYVRTNLDDRPVPGSISNPSSPVTVESNSKAHSEPSSPCRFISDEKIVPGAISSGLTMEPPNSEEPAN